MKILVVSQDYSGYDDNYGDIQKNVFVIREYYARFAKVKDNEFNDIFKIDYFFEIFNNYKDLQTLVAMEDYDLIHFSLHGYKGKVFFSENEEYTYSDFASIFDVNKKVGVVILNICKSAEMAEAISKNVGWVLAWSDEPSVAQTRKVSELFYVSLFRGHSIADSFKRVEDSNDINPVIYKPAKLQKQKGSKKQKLSSVTRFIAGLAAIIILIVLYSVFKRSIFDQKNTTEINDTSTLNPEKTKPVKGNLVITYPLPNSSVEPGDIIEITAKLQPESNPWVFISPPKSNAWYPQFEAISEDEEHWRVHGSIGNAWDTGQFTIIAIVIHDSIARDMRAWLNSQGTEYSSDPLNAEHLKSFYWYAADTIKVKRMPD